MQTWMREDVPLSDDSGVVCVVAGTLRLPFCYLRVFGLSFLLLSATSAFPPYGKNCACASQVLWWEGEVHSAHMNTVCEICKLKLHQLKFCGCCYN